MVLREVIEGEIMDNVFERTRNAIDKGKKVPVLPVKGTSFIPQFNKIVTGIDPDDTVSLVPDPDNKYDPYAVRIIHDKTGEFIGHLPKENCPEYHDEITKGNKWNAIIDTVYDPVNGNSAGIRIVLDPIQELSVPESELVSIVLKYLDVSNSEATVIARSFMSLAKELAQENGMDMDDKFDMRVHNSAVLFLKGNTDIGLFTESALDDIAGEYAGLADNDPMSWDIEEIFDGLIPEFVNLGVAEEEKRICMSVTYDKDVLSFAPWTPGDPSSSLFGIMVNYVIDRISEPLGVSEIDFF